MYQSIILGLLAVGALLAGRRLFWLFVSVVGFIVGFQLATQYISGAPPWVIFLLAIGLGLLGALIAVALQYWAAALAGFGAGSLVAVTLVSVFGIEAGRLGWVFGLAGGIVGAVLILALFDWGLIFLSSATGAAVLTDLLVNGTLLSIVVFFVLLAVGIVVQSTIHEPAEIKRRTTRVVR